MENVKLKFIDDKLFIYTPCKGNIYKKQLIMTKEIFQECYKRWIEPQEVRKKEEGDK